MSSVRCFSKCDSVIHKVALTLSLTSLVLHTRQLDLYTSSCECHAGYAYIVAKMYLCVGSCVLDLCQVVENFSLLLSFVTPHVTSPRQCTTLQRMRLHSFLDLSAKPKGTAYLGVRTTKAGHLINPDTKANHYCSM